MATIVGQLNDLKFIYLHIPKTGGSSIDSWIEQAIHQKGSVEKIFSRHEILSSIHKIIPVKEYYVFTCVRNPWARTFSGYLNLKRHYDQNRKDMMKHILEEVLTLHKSFPNFNQFVELLPDTDSMIGDDWNQKTNQIDWCYPDVDRIMKLENISQDFLHIQQMFNNFEPLNHHNKSSTDLDYQNAYSEQSKKTVAKIFERDIDTFEYTFQSRTNS